MTTKQESNEVSAARRWSMLLVAQIATLSANVFINGVAFLIPSLAHRGTSLPMAALLASMPSFGMMLTLIAGAIYWTGPANG
jgi:hypothetical protein